MDKKQKSYLLKQIKEPGLEFFDPMFWVDIKPVKIDHYLWMDNGYQPDVFIKACYSDKFIYTFFNVFEEKVTIKYTKTNDPVFKDSCVEFFINLFPDETPEYFNIEMNAIGTIKMGIGIKRVRKYLDDSDLKEMHIVSSIKEPLIGKHGSDSWQLFCAIPINVLEKFYNRKFRGDNAIGNFYKCGDETDYKHYGMWNLIDNPKPDFHLPEYFGNILFEE